MKAKYLAFCLIFLSVTSFLWGSVCFRITVQESVDAKIPKRTTAPLLSCSIFTVALGNKTFYGNSEDAYKPGSYIWFEFTGYDAVHFGFDNNGHPYDGYSMGGMNIKGLCVDTNAVPNRPLNPHPELPPIEGDLIRITLQECATVTEAIEWCQNHNFGSSLGCQIHFADATGDAVVVSTGTDKELAFTRKGDSNYLISTNYNLANPSNNYVYPCERYDTMEEMLGKINAEQKLTVEACSDIIKKVQNNAAYCNIFDLKTRETYVYYPKTRSFRTYVKLNLTEELAKGSHTYLIPELFNHTVSLYSPRPPFTMPPISESTITTSAGFFMIGTLVIGFISLTLIFWRKRRKQDHPVKTFQTGEI